MQGRGVLSTFVVVLSRLSCSGVVPCLLSGCVLTGVYRLVTLPLIFWPFLKALWKEDQSRRSILTYLPLLLSAPSEFCSTFECCATKYFLTLLDEWTGGLIGFLAPLDTPSSPTPTCEAHVKLRFESDSQPSRFLGFGVSLFGSASAVVGPLFRQPGMLLQAAEICRSLGFTDIETIKPGGSTTVKDVEIQAFRGSLVGPPWSEPQNGYCFKYASRVSPVQQSQSCSCNAFPSTRAVYVHMRVRVCARHGDRQAGRWALAKGIQGPSLAPQLRGLKKWQLAVVVAVC